MVHNNYWLAHRIHSHLILQQFAILLLWGVKLIESYSMYEPAEACHWCWVVVKLGVEKFERFETVDY